MTLAHRLRVAPFLLALLLIAGPLAAETCDHRPQGAWPSRLGIPGVVYEAWAFMSRIWSKAGGSSDPFGKEGSSTDPFGKGSSSCAPFGKEGSSSDPFGKSGSSTDPFGKPEPGAAQPVSVFPSTTGGTASQN
jgi:hypothetical protein